MNDEVKRRQAAEAAAKQAADKNAFDARLHDQVRKRYFSTFRHFLYQFKTNLLYII